MRDKDKISEYNRIYRENNKEKIRKLQKYHYDNHRSERVESARAWVIKNPERAKQTRSAYMSTPRGRLNSIKSSAKTRKIEYSLSEDEAMSILILACHYCGACDRIGIDRKNSGVGYITENCVPCCSMCNYMKSIYTHEEFVAQCKRIASFHT